MDMTAVLLDDATKNLANYPDISYRLKIYSNLIAQSSAITNELFTLIADKNITAASEKMAIMDKKFRLALLELAKISNQVRVIQKSQLLQYHKEAKAILYLEFYVVLFILLLVCLIVYFGRKIKFIFDQLIYNLKMQGEELEQNQEKLKTLFNVMLDPIILINDKGIIEYVNKEAVNIFQYNKDEMQGQNIKMLMPQPYKDEHDQYIKNYLDTGRAKVIGSTRKVRALKKDGTEFPIELGVSEMHSHNHKMFVGVIRDITADKKNQLYLEGIDKIQSMYISGAEQSTLFDTILKFLLDYTGSEYGFIGAIFKDDNNKLYLKTYAISNIAWNDATRKFYDENAPYGLEFKNMDTLFGHTIKTAEVVIANDPSNDPRAGGLPEGHPAMHAYLGMPIIGKGGLIAMYGMANKKNGYTEQDVVELKTISTVMGIIIESVRNADKME